MGRGWGLHPSPAITHDRILLYDLHRCSGSTRSIQISQSENIMYTLLLMYSICSRHILRKLLHSTIISPFLYWTRYLTSFTTAHFCVHRCTNCFHHCTNYASLHVKKCPAVFSTFVSYI